MIFTIIQILEKQNQFPDIEKLMSDWLKRLSKVLLVTDKFTVQIKQGYKEAKELWKNDYCRILKKAIAIPILLFFCWVSFLILRIAISTDFGTLDNTGSGYAQGIDVFWRDKENVKNLDYWIRMCGQYSQANGRDS